MLKFRIDKPEVVPAKNSWDGRTQWTRPIPPLNQPYEKPKPDAANIAWHKDVICFRCNNVGHIAKNCRSNSAIRDQRGNSRENFRGNRTSKIGRASCRERV